MKNYDKNQNISNRFVYYLLMLEIGGLLVVFILLHELSLENLRKK